MIPFLKRLGSARITVLLAFIGAHAWLIWTGSRGPGHPMGDIGYAYHPWAHQMLMQHTLMGLNTKWVYPYPDLLFTLFPAYIPFLQYQTAWLVMTTAIDVAALLVLLYWPFRFDLARVTAGWFWILALLALGPVSISRLDTISISLAVVGLVAWLQAKPEVASVWFAIATWVKVWPIALLSATILEAKSWKKTLIAGLSAGIGILLIGFLWGNPGTVLGFVSEQTGRGIQIESPWATYWLWRGVDKIPGSGIYLSHALNTFQVKGPGVGFWALILGPTTYLALLLSLLLGWLAIRRVKGENIALRNEIFAWTALTAVLDLIVFNKVGSPQYYGWLIVPAILGLIERVPNWNIVWIWVLGILGVTGVVYPIIYDYIIGRNAWATAVLGVRNGLTVALLIFGTIRMFELLRTLKAESKADQPSPVQ